jgi:hypothetical protein
VTGTKVELVGLVASLGVLLFAGSHEEVSELDDPGSETSDRFPGLDDVARGRRKGRGILVVGIVRDGEHGCGIKPVSDHPVPTKLQLTSISLKNAEEHTVANAVEKVGCDECGKERPPVVLTTPREHSLELDLFLRRARDGDDERAVRLPRVVRRLDEGDGGCEAAHKLDSSAGLARRIDDERPFDLLLDALGTAEVHTGEAGRSRTLDEAGDGRVAELDVGELGSSRNQATEEGFQSGQVASVRVADNEVGRTHRATCRGSGTSCQPC